MAEARIGTCPCQGIVAATAVGEVFCAETAEVFQDPTVPDQLHLVCPAGHDQYGGDYLLPLVTPEAP